MDKTSGFTQLHAGFEELVEMHHEKVSAVITRVKDMHVRGVLNDDQADTYIKDLRRAEINSDRLDQIGNILDREEEEAIKRAIKSIYTAVSHTVP